jgi:hypothetical protein
VRRPHVPGENASLKMIGERVGAWWTSVIAGQADQSHPIQGTKIAAKIEGDTLVVRGKVPTQADLEEIRAEVEHLAGHGVAHVRVEVAVEEEGTQQKGLLRQTLVGAFETEELAGFAAGYLEGHAHVAREAMLIVEADGNDAPKDRAALDYLGPPYADQVRATLDAGRSVLIVSVDEVDAFRVRELLDEETRSLETLVLPPQPASPERPRPNDDGAPADRPNARAAQQQALDEEAKTHAG